MLRFEIQTQHMSSFKNILVPVDFSINTEVALKKAAAIADEEAIIHLLHVSQFDIYRRYFLHYTGSVKNTWRSATLEKLHRYKSLLEQSNKKLVIKICIARGISIQHAIESKAKKIGAGLIVVGKKKNHEFLPFLLTTHFSESSATTVGVLQSIL